MNRYVIGCLPLSEFSKPPKDVPGCKKDTCPYCKEDMWVGPKKRKFKKELEEKREEFFYGCIPCAVIMEKIYQLNDKEFNQSILRSEDYYQKGNRN